MEKNFSKIEIAVIKSTAKNVAQYVAKKEKIDAKIAELQAEKKDFQSIIESMNEPVKKITGGYTTEDLVNKVVEGTGKLDANGKEVMTTRFVLKYPETVIPCECEGTSEAEEPEEIPEPTQEEVEAQEAAQADPFAGEGEWS